MKMNLCLLFLFFYSAHSDKKSQKEHSKNRELLKECHSRQAARATVRETNGRETLTAKKDGIQSQWLEGGAKGNGRAAQHAATCWLSRAAAAVGRQENEQNFCEKLPRKFN